MANPERGEVDLVAGESVYTLALTMNGIAELEARTGKNYGEIVQMMSPGARINITITLQLLWQTLKRAHGKQFPTLASVGDFVDGLPKGEGTATEALLQLLVLNADRRNGRNGHPADPPAAQT